MGSDKDFIQAKHSLIDPLIEPDPSDETGLNAHFGSTFAPRKEPLTPPADSAGSKEHPSVHIRHHSTGSSAATNPFLNPQNTGFSVESNPYRRSRGSSASKAPVVQSGDVTPKRRYDYPSPPNSASPRRDHFGDARKEAFGAMNTGRPRGSSQPTNPHLTVPIATRPTRGGSLRERYPGDPSVRPLETIRKDTKTAHRAHHLRKKNFSGADIIDRLDKTNIGGASYHHEGPYDAANISRNTSYKHSPVAAVKDSNEEALRATPRENIVDAVKKHRPLEGTAIVPPGMPDRMGRTYDYKEGADLMREPGADYKRWPGVTYLPEDLKGKGEPSFTIEKALKDAKAKGTSGTEMESRRRRNISLGANDPPAGIPAESPLLDTGRSSGIGRSNTTGKSVGEALKKRFGSMRKKKVES